jgi:hypothetical protein
MMQDFRVPLQSSWQNIYPFKIYGGNLVIVQNLFPCKWEWGGVQGIEWLRIQVLRLLQNGQVLCEKITNAKHQIGNWNLRFICNLLFVFWNFSMYPLTDDH